MSRVQTDSENLSGQAKLNCLYLFRRVLTAAENNQAPETRQQALEHLLPRIFTTLESEIEQADSDMKVLVPCLMLLNELLKMHPE